MWQCDIPKERRFGITRCTRARVDTRGLESVLSMFGLYPRVDVLTEVPTSRAQEILEALLWKDLAYGLETMPLERARDLAKEFVSSPNDQTTKFYANADWSQYHQRLKTQGGFSFSGLTDSTFDGGVVALGGGFASCVWVEDED